MKVRIKGNAELCGVLAEYYRGEARIREVEAKIVLAYGRGDMGRVEKWQNERIRLVSGRRTLKEVCDGLGIDRNTAQNLMYQRYGK